MSGDNREVFELAAQGLRLVNRADEVAAQMGVVERNHQAQMTQFRQELETLKRQEAEIRARIDSLTGGGPQLRLTVNEPAPAKPKRKPKPRVKRDDKLRHKALLVMWAVGGQRCSKRELCERIGRTMSTQGGALSNMRRDGLIDYDRKGEHAKRWAWLTEKGRRAAGPLVDDVLHALRGAADPHRMIVDMGYAADRKNAGLILKRLNERGEYGQAAL